MDVDKIFNDLESNQTHEYDEAKRQLVEYFGQNKEQWFVHNLMDYYLKTGSERIMEVLVKVQTPHDVYILDRLSEWLRNQTYRVQALEFFSFVVRKHPTWLVKIEKHRLIKDIIKLLLTEKEIVPLMSALLCIITLLPLIPNFVPNFLFDLFEVFSHLVTWNSHQQMPRLSEEKLVHLQLGVQMLFHQLYAMYPCNFIGYLSEFCRKDRGAVFHHTIIPLLKTVRVHPLLVTASSDNELHHTRWKEVEPHDVVIECMELSLPLIYNPKVKVDHKVPLFSSDWLHGTSEAGYNSAYTTNSRNFSNEFKKFPRYIREPNARFDSTKNSNANVGLWSPYNEINFSVPVTPTPSLMLPLPAQPSSNFGQFGLTGSSPPEAAVEATPETTPLKDIKQMKHNAAAGGPGVSNSHAVRAIFTSSQPSSPMRKDQNQFHYPNTSPTMILEPRSSQHDRMIQQMIEDRTLTHGTFKPIDSQVSKFVHTPTLGLPSPVPSAHKRETPDIELDPMPVRLSATPILRTPKTNFMPVQQITKVCDDCNETDRTMCTAGGVQIPTSRSLHLLASGMKRNRMASYCSDKTWAGQQDHAKAVENVKVRRTKSCSSIDVVGETMAKSDKTEAHGDEVAELSRRRLQKSGKMLAVTCRVNASTQTLSSAPNSYESRLISMLMCNNDKQNEAEASLLYPQELLDQFLTRVLRRDSDHNYRSDHESLQLLTLQLQYERYRREIHAERNRRLMGRNRTKHSLEMERDRLQEQLKDCAAQNKQLLQQIDKTVRKSNEQEQRYLKELKTLNVKYEKEIEQTRCLRQANDNLQSRLVEEISIRKDISYELEKLRGQIFNLTKELQHAESKAEIGMQCKDELARLEAEMIVMGEVQVKCRDRLAEVDSHKARDAEMQMMQETFSLQLKEMKRCLEEKSSQLDTAKQKIVELQSQVQSHEKVIPDQKRLLRAVKHEYEEKLKALNNKYDVQKSIIMQMEEKIVMFLQKPQMAGTAGACSPDTDRTDIASSVERNSPLSTSLASSESLSASLRSTELRNLQQLVVDPVIAKVGVSSSTSSGINVVGAGANIIEGTRVPTLDLASSANTATAINIVPTASTSGSSGIGIGIGTHNYDVISTLTTHTHPHLHLQQQQKEKQLQKQKR